MPGRYISKILFSREQVLVLFRRLAADCSLQSYILTWPPGSLLLKEHCCSSCTNSLVRGTFRVTLCFAQRRLARVYNVALIGRIPLQVVPHHRGAIGGPSQPSYPPAPVALTAGSVSL